MIAVGFQMLKHEVQRNDVPGIQSESFLEKRLGTIGVPLLDECLRCRKAVSRIVWFQLERFVPGSLSLIVMTDSMGEDTLDMKSGGGPPGALEGAFANHTA